MSPAAAFQLTDTEEQELPSEAVTPVGAAIPVPRKPALEMLTPLLPHPLVLRTK